MEAGAGALGALGPGRLSWEPPTSWILALMEF